MSTLSGHQAQQINRHHAQFSPLRATVETAFYQNNMTEVHKISVAYELAKHHSGTIVLDQQVAHAKQLGLPEDAHVLVENGGSVTGRTAAARRLWGTNEDTVLLGLVREAIYKGSQRPFYKTTAFVGLNERFMVRAHLAVPKEDVGNLYSWLLNFQWASAEFKQRYDNSVRYAESDIFLYSDPTWHHPDYPYGLAYFDPQANVAVVLGLQYFGELKKATLTLAWTIAHRHQYLVCHGGQKAFQIEDKTFVAAFFGLSGTGKSTLTHAKHDGQFAVQVLHDDAFIVSLVDGHSIALEPAYFDKTQDYPAGHSEQRYFVTVQNVGVTLNELGERVLVTQDIRNGNGRTVKSRFATPNRVDVLSEPINVVFWLMKDDALPPVLQLNRADLATIFGVTLATKRSTAENVVTGTNRNQLVIEPFANPFRVYPLAEECAAFETLFDTGKVACYVLNTGSFLDKKVTPETTLGIIEEIVLQRAVFEPFGPLEHVQYMPLSDYPVDFNDSSYRALIHERLQLRADWLATFNKKHPNEALPYDYITSLKQLQIGLLL